MDLADHRGTSPPGVRPVSDRAREGVFSSLGDLVRGARVLDLYAGTGALGIEALSRGAASAVFVERAPRAHAAIRENLRRTGLAERATLVRGGVERFLDRAVERAFDLIFLDPPYAADAALRSALERLNASGSMAEDATVLVTRASRDPNDVIPVDWAVAKRLTYGDSVVMLLRNQPRATEE